MPQPTGTLWDDRNEADHVGRHGVPFAFAALVFNDPGRLEDEDVRPNRRGERRWNTVGVVAGRCIHVTYAMSGDTAEIISARSASRKERKTYGYRA